MVDDEIMFWNGCKSSDTFCERELVLSRRFKLIEIAVDNGYGDELRRCKGVPPMGEPAQFTVLPLTFVWMY